MSIRADLETAVAKVENDWRRANEDLDKARAARANVDLDWDKVGAGRRRRGANRRNAGMGWDQAFPDRRNPDADRRAPGGEILALCKAVADRHVAYTNRSKAEAVCATAAARLQAVAAERDKAIAALEALNRGSTDA